MSHTRGQIKECKDMFNNSYYRIYTGCKHLDDFYTTDTYSKALELQQELNNKDN